MDTFAQSKLLLADTDPQEIQMVNAACKTPEAFVGLYDRYVLRVYRYILHRTGDELVAEDLTSQVFLDALKNLPRISPRVPFGAWLFTIARRRIADYFRKLHPITSFEENQNLPSIDADPLKELIQTERLIDLEAQLATLDERDRELLRLRFTAELSFGEISVLLGQKENTIKKSFYRLLDRLGRRMEAEND
jgi:RNA polymerase sigma-70 factor (ECF subfamily)